MTDSQHTLGVCNQRGLSVRTAFARNAQENQMSNPPQRQQER